MRAIFFFISFVYFIFDIHFQLSHFCSLTILIRRFVSISIIISIFHSLDKMSVNCDSLAKKLAGMKKCDVILTRCDAMPEYVQAEANVQCAKRFRIDSEDSIEFIEQPSQIINLLTDDEDEDTLPIIDLPRVNNNSINMRSFSASQFLSSTAIARPEQLPESILNLVPRPLKRNDNVENVPPNSGEISSTTLTTASKAATTSSLYSTAELDPLSVSNSNFNRHPLKQTFDLLIKEDERVRLKTKELAFKLKEKTDSEHDLKQTINEMTSTIDKQKRELAEKDSCIDRMKTLVEGLNDVCTGKEREMLEIKGKLINLVDEQNALVQKAIDDTKAKEWCVNCKEEAVNNTFKLPVCSAECLSIIW